MKITSFMKCSFLLVFIALLQFTANAAGQTPVSIHMKNVEINQVFATLEKESGYHFLFNSRLTGIHKMVDVDADNADISEVLKSIFTGTNLQFKMLDNKLIVISSGDVTDDIIVKGKVTGDNNEPLSGVSITVKGTTTGTTTDAGGLFTISVSENATLVFSSVGYQSQEVAINNQTSVNVHLVLSASNMDQVVVIGYGTQKRVDLTGAVGSVKGTDLVKQPVVTLTQAMQGQLAGVQVISSGQPGSAPQVRIRGTGSILAGAEPLYVVDGIITDDITNINTADIQTVDVLKDASSTAIYGARAANGVVLITTRQGTGKMKLNYSVNVGFNQAANLVKMANSTQYLAYEQAALGPPLTATGYSTDWYSQILRTGFYQNHNLSMSGGSDKNKYLLSVGYTTDEGIVIVNNYTRLTARFNNEFTVNEYLKLGILASYSHSVSQNVPLGSIFPDAYRAAPVVPGMLDGKYGNTSKFQNVGNPILDAHGTDDQSIDNRIQGAAYIEITPFKGLTFKSTFGDEVDFYNDRQYTYQLPNDTTVFTENGGSQGPSQSVLALTSTTYYHWTWDNTLTYKKSIDKSNFTILVGTTAEKYQKNGFTGERKNVPPNPNLWYLQNGDENLQFNGSAGIPDEYTRNSYLGRIFYSYDNKYLLTATFRADGSSVFPIQNQWGYFPSISAGWLINREDFMEKQDLFQTLKLRAGWGRVGNSNIPSDASSLTLLANQPYFFGSTVTSGSFVPQIKDPNIKWESSDETDIGLDFGLLKNKLTGTIDVYDKKTNNALILVRVPATFGSQPNSNSSITPGYVLTNAAEIENKGLEFSINWAEKVNDKISYHVGANVTFNKNNVIGLNGGAPYFDGDINGYFTTETTNGHPIGSFFVRKMIGVFQNQAEIDAYTDPKTGKELQPDAQPGDLKYQFTNGVIDTTFAGAYQPVAYFGINGGINYGNFDFSIDLYGNVGNKVYNGKKQNRTVFTDNIEEATATKRWTNTNPSQTEPRANGGNLPASTYFVESGDFLRINNMVLGYNFPARSLGSQKVISNLRIYLSAQNPLTLKKYSGFTPELPGSSPTNAGIELGTYPSVKTYTLGINVGF
jgi:TonB-dependent starch-binding outer membrane protein SusC